MEEGEQKWSKGTVIKLEYIFMVMLSGFG